MIPRLLKMRKDKKKEAEEQLIAKEGKEQPRSKEEEEKRARAKAKAKAKAREKDDPRAKRHVDKKGKVRGSAPGLSEKGKAKKTKNKHIPKAKPGLKHPDAVRISPHEIVVYPPARITDKGHRVRRTKVEIRDPRKGKVLDQFKIKGLVNTVITAHDRRPYTFTMVAIDSEGNKSRKVISIPANEKRRKRRPPKPVHVPAPRYLAKSPSSFGSPMSRGLSPLGGGVSGRSPLDSGSSFRSPMGGGVPRRAPHLPEFSLHSIQDDMGMDDLEDAIDLLTQRSHMVAAATMRPTFPRGVSRSSSGWWSGSQSSRSSMSDLSLGQPAWSVGSSQHSLQSQGSFEVDTDQYGRSGSGGSDARAGNKGGVSVSVRDVAGESVQVRRYADSDEEGEGEGEGGGGGGKGEKRAQSGGAAQSQQQAIPRQQRPPSNQHADFSDSGEEQDLGRLSEGDGEDGDEGEDRVGASSDEDAPVISHHHHDEEDELMLESMNESQAVLEAAGLGGVRAGKQPRQQAIGRNEDDEDGMYRELGSDGEDEDEEGGDRGDWSEEDEEVEFIRRKLPPGWTAFRDEENNSVYYYHEESERTQWEPPAPVEEEDKALENAISSLQPGTVMYLPVGSLAGEVMDIGEEFEHELDDLATPRPLYVPEGDAMGNGLFEFPRATVLEGGVFKDLALVQASPRVLKAARDKVPPGAERNFQSVYIPARADSPGGGAGAHQGGNGGGEGAGPDGQAAGEGGARGKAGQGAQAGVGAAAGGGDGDAGAEAGSVEGDGRGRKKTSAAIPSLPVQFDKHAVAQEVLQKALTPRQAELLDDDAQRQLASVWAPADVVRRMSGIGVEPAAKAEASGSRASLRLGLGGMGSAIASKGLPMAEMCEVRLPRAVLAEAVQQSARREATPPRASVSVYVPSSENVHAPEETPKPVDAQGHRDLTPAFLTDEALADAVPAEQANANERYWMQEIWVPTHKLPSSLVGDGKGNSARAGARQGPALVVSQGDEMLSVSALYVDPDDLLFTEEEVANMAPDGKRVSVFVPSAGLEDGAEGGEMEGSVQARGGAGAGAAVGAGAAQARGSGQAALGSLGSAKVDVSGLDRSESLPSVRPSPACRLSLSKKALSVAQLRSKFEALAAGNQSNFTPVHVPVKDLEAAFDEGQRRDLAGARRMSVVGEDGRPQEIAEVFLPKPVVASASQARLLVGPQTAAFVASSAMEEAVQAVAARRGSAMAVPSSGAAGEHGSSSAAAGAGAVNVPSAAAAGGTGRGAQGGAQGGAAVGVASLGNDQGGGAVPLAALSSAMASPPERPGRAFLPSSSLGHLVPPSKARQHEHKTLLKEVWVPVALGLGSEIMAGQKVCAVLDGDEMVEVVRAFVDVDEVFSRQEDAASANGGGGEPARVFVPSAKQAASDEGSAHHHLRRMAIPTHALASALTGGQLENFPEEARADYVEAWVATTELGSALGVDLVQPESHVRGDAKRAVKRVFLPRHLVEGGGVVVGGVEGAVGATSVVYVPSAEAPGATDRFGVPLAPSGVLPQGGFAEAPEADGGRKASRPINIPSAFLQQCVLPQELRERNRKSEGDLQPIFVSASALQAAREDVVLEGLSAFVGDDGIDEVAPVFVPSAMLAEAAANAAASVGPVKPGQMRAFVPSSAGTPREGEGKEGGAHGGARSGGGAQPVLEAQKKVFIPRRSLEGAMTEADVQGMPPEYRRRLSAAWVSSTELECNVDTKIRLVSKGGKKQAMMRVFFDEEVLEEEAVEADDAQAHAVGGGEAGQAGKSKHVPLYVPSSQPDFAVPALPAHRRHAAPVAHDPARVFLPSVAIDNALSPSGYAALPPEDADKFKEAWFPVEELTPAQRQSSTTFMFKAMEMVSLYIPVHNADHAPRVRRGKAQTRAYIPPDAAPLDAPQLGGVGGGGAMALKDITPLYIPTKALEEAFEQKAVQPPSKLKKRKGLAPVYIPTAHLEQHGLEAEVIGTVRGERDARKSLSVALVDASLLKQGARIANPGDDVSAVFIPTMVFTSRRARNSGLHSGTFQPVIVDN